MISEIKKDDGYAILESAEDQPHVKVLRAQPCKVAGENLVLASFLSASKTMFLDSLLMRGLLSVFCLLHGI